MKKTGLFKIIMFTLLGILVLTWIIPASYFTSGELTDLGMYRIGFFDFFQLLFGTFEFSYFIQIIILLVSVGALYSVLGKTGKYRAWIERIASKFKGKELIFLIVVAFLIAAITSAFDYGIASFIFIPAIISIILAMKYDKITAFITTFGAYLIGIMGSTINASIVNTINSQLTDVTLSTGIYYKVALFVVSFAILIFYLYKAKKTTKKVAKSKDKDKEEDAIEDDMFIGEKIANKYPVWPIITVFAILFVLLVLGCTSWETVFGVTFFSDMNDAIVSWTIKDVTVAAYVIGTLSAFGEWYYAEMAVMCILASILIGKIYHMKFSDVIKYMGEGALKILPTALLTCLTYAVVYFAGNTMFFPTIAGWLLGATSKFNLFFASLTTILGSALHVDMLYISNYMVAQVAATTSNQMLVGLITQGFYGLTMFVVPSSAMLALGLSYLGIPYKEWLKKSWKFVLELFVAVVVISLIAMLV